MSKALVIPHGPLSAAESRKVLIVIEVEASFLPSLTSDKFKIDRVRCEDGRWLKVNTWHRRLKALGARLVEIRPQGPGEHTPNY